ncbi:MAG TPA: response regulator [Polyangia bacterium]|jgi:CheY-like chemotaxis protein
MRLSLRAKLIAIVGAAAGAFVVLIVSGQVIAHRADEQLANVQERFLPKLEIGPQLEKKFDRLHRGIEDAVAARDMDALVATRAVLDEFLHQLEATPRAVEPAAGLALRGAVEQYYALATDLARRLMAGETGEALLASMTAMQTSQARVAERLRTAISFDRGELTGAFTMATRAQVTAARVRLGISIACLALVIILSYSLGRGVLRSLTDLTSGLHRFGRGDFARPIAVVENDELGDVARQANVMAESLRHFAEQRDYNDWIKGALVGLGQELRGELSPTEVANRAVAFLARYLGAVAAALYYAEGDGTLRLVGQHALSGAPVAATPAFRPGEGLVGQAATRTDLMLVDEPPADYLRIRSGLGEGRPRVIALLPLVHLGRVTGVLELATFSAWSDRFTEALLAMRENLVIAIEVARARDAMRELLGETQRQTIRLTDQEEKLRANNEALESQQETLRKTNRDLVRQAEQLDAQRRDLEVSNAELDEARRTLEQKAAELSTVSAYKSQFLTNMSHELRTPLNSMLLLSKLLAENEQNNLSPKQVEFASTIHVAGKDLLALINQVLDLAKIEAGKHELHITEVPLRQLAANLKMMFGPLARDKKLELSIEIAPDAPSSITTDRQRIEQILKNLLANAIKFTSQGGVTLRIGRPPEALRPRRIDLPVERALAFAVVDTGLGVAEADQARIFAPFEQVEGSVDRRFGGTGLGLSISRELAGLLGGELTLESTLGQGSTFTCVVPIEHMPQPEAPDDRPRPPPTHAPSSAPAGPDRPTGEAALLLLIEDDPIFAESLRNLIHAQGLECLVGADGESGLRLARERRPTGILLDVRLPDIDGWRVMELLRAEPATASIPVHFVSAADAPARGLALGAVGFLTKPATRHDLQVAVDTLLARHHAGTARILIVEDDVEAGSTLVKLLGHEQIDVRHVTRAYDALALLEREKFGCVVLDLRLPDMDGLQFLHQLRERYGAAAPAIVIYTARALNRTEIKALEAYAEAVVLKEGASNDRLVDEVRRFVLRLKEGGAARRPAAGRLLRSADVHIERKTILVVDDDMRTVYALSALLRGKGAEVLVADTGQSALDALDRRPDVDAVLMDLIMPEMNGYQAMQRIRQDSRFKDLPVIALTARAMTGDESNCLSAGASAYLPKPVDSERLLTELHDRLQPRPSP